MRPSVRPPGMHGPPYPFYFPSGHDMGPGTRPEALGPQPHMMGFGLPMPMLWPPFPRPSRPQADFRRVAPVHAAVPSGSYAATEAAAVTPIQRREVRRQDSPSGRPDIPPLPDALVPACIDDALAQAPEQFAGPRHGVIVTPEAFDFAPVALQGSTPAAPRRQTVIVSLKGAPPRTRLARAFFRPEQSAFVVAEAALPPEAMARGKVAVSVEFRPPTTVGCFRTWLLLELEWAISGTMADFTCNKFRIAVRVSGRTFRPEDEVALNAEAPIFWNRAWRDTQECQPKRSLATDPRTLSHDQVRFSQPLLLGPRGMTVEAEAIRQEEQEVSEIVKPHFFRDWSAPEYVYHMRLLLELEEAQHMIDMKHFDRFCERFQTLKLDSNAEHHMLGLMNIPGLHEHRPNVNLGDQVRLRCAYHLHQPLPDGMPPQEVMEIMALVVAAEQSRLTLRLPASPALLPPQGTNISWMVRFRHNAEVFAFMRTALQAVQAIPPNLLWPDRGPKYQLPGCSVPAGQQWDWVHSGINPEQQLAVRNIVLRSPISPPPYIVFGPPGTGKTLTVIEAILQLLRNSATVRVLALAPSNAAADIICDRLRQHQVSAKDMMRLNWHKRLVSSLLKTGLLPYCQQDRHTGLFTYPEVGQLLQYRVVVATCLTSHILRGLQVPPGHFSHIFVDEAGQALEAEVLVALTLAASRTSVVLAGDPKQLGPTVRNATARVAGLGLSLMERLMQLDMYQAKDHSGIFAKLLNNYRSNDRILQLFSKLFYNGQLRTCADVREVDSLSHWRWLPQVSEHGSFPLLFYGVAGKQQAARESGSLSNDAEASAILEVIEELMSQPETLRVGVQDFGVICAYRTQVNKVRRLLRARQLGAIRVGTVDDYQGQEAKITIISTVVTRRNLLAKRHPISDPKRFNVAISRAQALSVVIGNPYALYNDPFWGSLLVFCLTFKAYRGCPLPTGLQMMPSDANLASLACAAAQPTMDSAELRLGQSLAEAGSDPWHAMASEDLEWRVNL